MPRAVLPARGLAGARAADVPAVAAFVQAEVVPLADRDELDPTRRPRARSRRRLEAAIAALQARAAAGRPLRRPGRAWGRVLTTVDGARGVDALPVTDIAAAAYSLHDLGWRDGLIAWAAPGSLPLDALDGDSSACLLRTVSTPGPGITADHPAPGPAPRTCAGACPTRCAAEAAEVCALTACVLWAHGDGALATRRCRGRFGCVPAIGSPGSSTMLRSASGCRPSGPGRPGRGPGRCTPTPSGRVRALSGSGRRAASGAARTYHGDR